MCHMRVAASCGLKEAVDVLCSDYRRDELADTLRAFQAAQDEKNNYERNFAKSLQEMNKGNI